MTNQSIGDIDSKFRFIILAARRTRQLQSGSRPMVAAYGKKFAKIAMEEVAAGLVKYEIPEEPKVAKKRGSKRE